MKPFITMSIASIFFAILPIYSESSKCVFSYNPANTKLEWTAYKFTEKLGVKGTFDKITVAGNKESSSIQSTMEQAKFSIQSNDVNSGVPDRDGKIREYFFGSSLKAKTFEGSFDKVTGKNNGTAILNLQFNGKKKSIPVKYELNGNQLNLKGTLDVLDFGMSSGIQKLNEICLELHKGKDGISKLWSVVDFEIISIFDKNCK
ncbi:YceI family protein [Leptospira sp. GIMC2001]|uniref:YceI family protein n=1 Tax=Leptospira sp. GIMC2001 TaxID=1513297 RepID=UPI00234A44E3|nr:YceI family protein [Leptospira sp. GIMC2001]WCL49596.1 YceI family protein [Leptospira sp. GIMC2001]